MAQKEKLEEAKRLYQTANADQRYVLESLFPELKESEDERIRKELIFYLRYQHSISENFEDIGKWIAWLEKQGEQKPQRMISAEAKEAMYNKPAWSEEDQNALEDVREAVVHYWGGDSQDILLYWLKSLKQKIKGE